MPVLVFANKQDLLQALPPDQVKKVLHTLLTDCLTLFTAPFFQVFIKIMHVLQLFHMTSEIWGVPNPLRG